MQNEFITGKQAICIMMMFVMGSTLILGVGGEAKNDAWLAGIAGLLMSLPMILIYSRIHTLFKDKDLFEIMELSLGKVAGKLITLVYVLYAFHLGALVLRNFGELVNTINMPETPLLVPILCLGAVCIVGVRAGIESIGRFCTVFLPIILAILLIVQLMALHHFEMENLRPILGGGIAPILQGGFSVFAFPFAETVLFLGFLNAVRTDKPYRRLYMVSVWAAGGVIIYLTVRNIAVLGETLAMLYFPSYTAVSRVDVKDYIERIEVTVAIVFVVSAMVKGTVCLFFAGKGLAHLTGIADYRPLIIQLGLLMIYFSYTLYNNTEEMRYWAFKVYTYYAFPFQVILPVIIWIFAERKAGKLRNYTQ